jgi:Asp-tRNA(Asn)/Glu-tRNA(Gln) amidotransferase A subunit family amidase
LDLARAVQTKEISVVEVVDPHAARIEAHNADVNAIVLQRLEQNRGEAHAADAAVARRDLLGPLPL